MKNSIKNQLSVAIISLLLLTCGVNTLVNFYDVLQETLELQDKTLKEVAYYLDPQVNVYADKNLSNTQSELYIETSATPPAKRLLDITAQQASGFYDFQHNDDSYRYYLNVSERGYVVVMQNNAYRIALAVDVALDNVVPFLLLIPLLTGAIVWLIKRKMGQVSQLAEQISQRQGLDLTPIAKDNIPDEIQGFIYSINQLFQRTERLVHQQQRFIADASHEMRTPMTALSLQAERLSQQALPANLVKPIQQLQQGIQRNRHLIEQLLTLAKVQLDGHKVAKSAVDCQQLFKQVIETLLPLAQQKEQDLGVVGQANWRIYANETELFTLLKTLTDNALRYTPKGSQIDLGGYLEGENMVFFVEDNGEGIAPAERERVLEPFYRVLGTQQQGSGLGLAIAQSIVQRYGGELLLLDSQQFSSGLLVKIVLPKDIVSSI